MHRLSILAFSLLLSFLTLPAWAGENGTAEDAIAMTRKAVAYLKQTSPETAYSEITAKSPRFIDRDLYVVVYDFSGNCLAHGANPKLVGKNLIDIQDVDGIYYIRERISLAEKKDKFWHDYKFTDPSTRKISRKSTYCERSDSVIVCVGIYKP
ncbi:cache domain-containing protein [Nitrospirillum viridazoti]|uniref:Single cache domain-containing protein n=1 Tax=Nitrospirillum amazonense TaxID=28077 RepID=A0A560HNU9_9PROT|nr:cache domain-containing protein [Nitrospirillum amazonense]TWB48236.1 single cache domain-containing protein [Nitrospirillum amazonense]